MEQFNQFLSGLDRNQIVRWTAIYLVIYALIGACAGLAFGVLGALSAGVGAMTAATIGTQSSEAAAASTSLAAASGISIVLALLYIIAVPLCAVAAYGLFRHKAWSRNIAVIALGFDLLVSVFSIGNGVQYLISIVISGFFIYLFWSDPGIKQVLSE